MYTYHLLPNLLFIPIYIFICFIFVWFRSFGLTKLTSGFLIVYYTVSNGNQLQQEA